MSDAFSWTHKTLNGTDINHHPLVLLNHIGQGRKIRAHKASTSHANLVRDDLVAEAVLFEMIFSPGELDIFGQWVNGYGAVALAVRALAVDDGVDGFVFRVRWDVFGEERR